LIQHYLELLNYTGLVNLKLSKSTDDIPWTNELINEFVKHMKLKNPFIVFWPFSILNITITINMIVNNDYNTNVVIFLHFDSSWVYTLQHPQPI